jgi:carboxyl-terminal processing protease
VTRGNLKKILGAVVALSILGGAFIPVARVHADDKAANDTSGKDSNDTYKELSLFGEVFEKVREDYVEPVSDEKLIEAAINGMLTSLDPHSSYMNEKNYQDMQVQTKGEFGGLGLEVTEDNGLIKVVSPIDDTPASRADIKPGDLIVALDGEPVMGMTLADAVDKMRGEIGTDIKLTIKRGDVGEPFDVTLKREEIKIKSVKWDVKGRIGYIRISSFNEQTQPGLDAAIADINKRLNDKVQGYVLDLRNNPGGLLDQAISVSSTFLNGGEVVSTRGRKPDDIQRYDAKSNGDETHGTPMVVLINGGSASASEIVAGALQDHQRAILLGTQSFGKGSVQTIMQLQGHGAMRLTTARYYTPSGRSIQGKGITPDIVVNPAKIEEVEQTTVRHEADLKGALKNTDPTASADTVTTTTTTKKQTVPDNIQPVTGPQQDKALKTKPGDKAKPVGGEDDDANGQVDYQLERALDLLRGLSVFEGHDKAQATPQEQPKAKP